MDDTNLQPVADAPVQTYTLRHNGSFVASGTYLELLMVCVNEELALPPPDENGWNVNTPPEQFLKPGYTMTLDEDQGPQADTVDPAVASMIEPSTNVEIVTVPGKLDDFLTDVLSQVAGGGVTIAQAKESLLELFDTTDLEPEKLDGPADRADEREVILTEAGKAAMEAARFEPTAVLDTLYDLITLKSTRSMALEFLSTFYPDYLASKK